MSGVQIPQGLPILMSVFYCHHCDRHIDSDYVMCEEDPSSLLPELICESCYENYLETLEMMINRARAELAQQLLIKL